MKPFQPSPMAQVSTEDNNTLVFVRELRHAPERVWTALTEAKQLGEWAPFTADTDLSVPGASTIHMIDGDTVEDMTVVVSLVDPPHRLEYTWGPDRLVWELTPTATGTRLTLRHQITEGDDWVPKVAAGWHLSLDVAERLLDGDPVPPIRGQAARDYGYDTLVATYRDQLTAP